MKKQEDLGPVLEVGLEGVADGQMVECKKKQAVMKKEQSQSQKEDTPLFLLGS